MLYDHKHLNNHILNLDYLLIGYSHNSIHALSQLTYKANIQNAVVSL